MKQSIQQILLILFLQIQLSTNQNTTNTNNPTYTTTIITNDIYDPDFHTFSCISNCDFCEEESKCAQCTEGYYLDTKLICTICPIHSNECGFYLNQILNYKCHTKKWDGSECPLIEAETIEKCDKEYYYESGTCIQCPFGCTRCVLSTVLKNYKSTVVKAVCLECAANMIPSGDDCICSPGTIMNTLSGKNRCLSCHDLYGVFCNKYDKKECFSCLHSGCAYSKTLKKCYCDRATEVGCKISNFLEVGFIKDKNCYCYDYNIDTSKSDKNKFTKSELDSAKCTITCDNAYGYAGIYACDWYSYKIPKDNIVTGKPLVLFNTKRKCDGEKNNEMLYYDETSQTCSYCNRINERCISCNDKGACLLFHDSVGTIFQAPCDNQMQIPTDEPSNKKKCRECKDLNIECKFYSPILKFGRKFCDVFEGCVNCDKYKCVECKNGYYLDYVNSELYVCRKCEVEYCSKCIAADICSECEFGYKVSVDGGVLRNLQDIVVQNQESPISSTASNTTSSNISKSNICILDPTREQCHEKYPNCKKCNVSECLKCLPGYKFYFNYKDTSINCTTLDSCELLFYKEPLSSKQMKKLENCERCDIYFGFCTKCREGYKLNLVYNTCTKEIIKCFENCNKCTTKQKCDVCRENTILTSDKSDCLKCGVYNTHCLECFVTGVCKVCENGYYKSSIYNRCLKCDSNCDRCNYSKRCNDCKRNYILNDGICLACNDVLRNCSECFNGKCNKCTFGYILDPVRNQCLKCSEYYKDCKNCLKNNSFINNLISELNKDGTCKLCEQGMYYNHNKRECISCISKFTFCTECNELKCTKCVDNALGNQTHCICAVGYDSFIGSCISDILITLIPVIISLILVILLSYLVYRIYKYYKEMESNNIT